MTDQVQTASPTTSASLQRPSFARRYGKIVLGVFLVMAILGGGAAVFAQRFAGHWKLFRLVQQLELTGEQKTKFVTLFQQTRADLQKERPKIQEMREKMIQLFRQERPSKRELDALVSEWFDQARRITLSKTEVFLQVHETLTAKQRQILLEAAQKAQARRQLMIKQRGLDKPNYVPRVLK